MSIFLITIDFDLFMYLFSICLFSLMKCLLISLAHFLIGFLFYYWVLRVLFILDTRFLSEMLFANISFQSVMCNYLDRFIHREKGFNFDDAQFVFFLFFLFCRSHLMPSLRTLCLAPGTKDFLLFFFSRSVQFYVDIYI